MTRVEPLEHKQSLEIYRSRIELLIKQTNNASSEQGYALLLKSHELMEWPGCEPEFAQ